MNTLVASSSVHRFDWFDWMAHGTDDHVQIDETLMKAMCKGDKDALDALMARHMRSIYAFALSLVRHPEDAEDLTQETFVRCWTKAHTYKPGRVKVTTWLHTLTRNAAIDSYRRRRRWTLESESKSLEREVAQVVDEGHSPEIAFDERYRDEVFKESLDGLPERQRTAVLLCYMKGFSNQEAASVLGVSLDALVSLLARGRRALKSSVAALEAGGSS